jgi:dTMP kinase
MRPGVFVSIDGPGGVGKSTVVALLVEQLAGHGIAVHSTAEPSRTPLGELIRAGTEVYSGLALAHLVAGDRHHHLTAEIRPLREAGTIVLCDRYIPSSLVLQRMDGLAWEIVWQINAGMDRPDLAVVLNADPAVIAARMAHRGGPHSRFERQPDAAQTESDLYCDTVGRLAAAGWPVHATDTTTQPAHEVAAALAGRVVDLYTQRSSHAADPRPVPADFQHR